MRWWEAVLAGGGGKAGEGALGGGGGALGGDVGTLGLCLRWGKWWKGHREISSEQVPWRRGTDLGTTAESHRSVATASGDLRRPCRVEVVVQLHLKREPRTRLGERSLLSFNKGVQGRTGLAHATRRARTLSDRGGARC